jgi:tetratricopeptide (TPR) repeat protein
VSDPTERPTLLIVHVEPALYERPSDEVYRTVQPCRALGELEQVVVVSGPLHCPAFAASTLLEEADLLVICEAGEPDLLPIIDARRRQQRLTAYEINAHLLSAASTAEPWPRARDLVARSLPPQLARHADCLQLTTPALDSAFGYLNARRAVFPSHLWEAALPAPVRRPDRVVIGWGGSRAQGEDLAWALPAVRGVLERHPEVSLAVMGDAELQPLLTALPPGQVSFAATGTLDEYGRFLDGVDIGLAPLLPTEFNRCRSDVRFVEYAAHGVLAVCSDLEPYRDVVRPGQTGFLFRDIGELETVIERALAEVDLRGAITARAARYVAAERLERPHAGDRLAFYLAAAAQLGFTLAPRHAFNAGALLLDRRNGARQFPGSRYLALGGSELERLLASGLAHQRAGELEEARRCFAEAARLAPGAYTPQLLLGATAADPAEAVAALRRAEALAPRSCHAAYLLGARLADGGDAAAAAAAFERAHAAAPSFGAPQERLGELAEAAGRIEEACKLYEEAALRNSAFALPVARLATAALRTGRIEKAVGLLERSLKHDPELWLTNYLVGRAYVELKRFHQARAHLLRALDAADDRPAVLAELAKAEVGLGNVEAARGALEESRKNKG